jgi:hypothetical protein
MSTEAKISKDRRAQIFVGDKNRNIRVFHPGLLTRDDIERIDVKVIDVVKELTGCSCLSGTIDVIWERNFDRVLDVQLGAEFRG